jgi:hypothetical protein
MGCFHDTLQELEETLSEKTILNIGNITDKIRDILYKYDINTPEKTVNLIEFWFCRTDADENNRIDIHTWGVVSKEILLLTGLGTIKLLPNTRISLETEVFTLSSRVFLPIDDDTKKINTFFSLKSVIGEDSMVEST